MLFAVRLQIIALVVVALLAAIGFGMSAARSVVLGGAAAVIPSGLFAWVLTHHQGRPAMSYPVIFLTGELVKIALTVVLLGAVVRWGAPVNWLALLAGLIVTLKAPLFALALPGDPLSKPGPPPSPQA